MVLTSGSAGTHAGTLVGMLASGSRIPVTGISIRRKVAEQEALVRALAEATQAFLGFPKGVAPQDLRILDDYVGAGYSIPTEGMVEAVRMVARLDGVLLDPVYTGKAMAGLVDLVRKGRFKRGEKVLFLHTGGAAALYAYEDVLRGRAPTA
jgi:D-cysteine desulfhydrase